MYRRKPHGWIKHIDFIILDVISLLISFAVAGFVRHGADFLTYANLYSGVFTFYLLVVLLRHILNNTFSAVMKRGYYKELMHTVKNAVVSEMAAIVYLFATQSGEDVSRIIIGLVGVFYVLIGYCVRVWWKRVIHKRGQFTSKASLYIITTQERASSVVEWLCTMAKWEYHVQGVCLTDEDRTGDTIGDIPVTSNIDTVLTYLRDKWVDEVYIAMPKNVSVPDQLIDRLVEMGFAVHVELDDAGSESWQIRQVQYVAKKMVQTISMSDISGEYWFGKRVLDILGGVVGCTIAALLTVIIGPIIYFHSPGPIFFSQMRVGKNGKPFKMYKFRSMYLDAEERKAELMEKNRISDGLMFKLDADPRIIGCKILPDGTVKKGIGNFIRDFSLDEFPQFLNVLKGEISLVGTRPPTLDEWEKYDPHHRARLAGKPGITGLWQVSGRSDITDFEQVVELDKKYIRECSMGMDLRILLKTVLVVLGRKGSM